MIMLTTDAVLTAIAGHLADAGLAQFDPEGRYLNSEVPAILWADSDTPDCCLVLSVVDQDAPLGHWNVELAWRTTGIAPKLVEALADNLFDHLTNTLGDRAEGVVWFAGTIVELPTLRFPGVLEWTDAQRTSRGRAERTSEAAHKGQRWTRRDTWRMTMLCDESALPMFIPASITE